jgi:hypothetical protein
MANVFKKSGSNSPRKIHVTTLGSLLIDNLLILKAIQSQEFMDACQKS